ncbi:MAG: penicillin acylase family protein, partial [Bacteroidales bacterium]|nr:penicillin acylase family protein [Bacteroidales bacterium]
VNTENIEESFQDLVVPAWNASVDWLTENYGTDMNAWIWGDLHQVSMTHPLGSVNLLKKIFKLEKGPFRVGGSDHTISPYTYPLLRPFVVTDGASQRHIYSILDPDDSRIIMPTGVSGIPASDFFCNQSEMYIRNEYISESFSREKVEKNAHFRSIFMAK